MHAPIARELGLKIGSCRKDCFRSSIDMLKKTLETAIDNRTSLSGTTPQTVRLISNVKQRHLPATNLNPNGDET